MSRYRLYLTIGFPGAAHEEYVDLAEDEDPEEYAKEWAFNYIEYGYDAVDAEDEE